MISIRNVRFLCIALLLSCSIPAFARPTSKNLYQRALQLQKDLKGSDQQQQKLAEWKKVISAFRSVYYTYPSSSYSDNSLFQVAALYGEMGSRFHDNLYFRRACSSYEFLVAQYKSSSLVSDAMLEY